MNKARIIKRDKAEVAQQAKPTEQKPINQTAATVRAWVQTRTNNATNQANARQQWNALWA